MLALDAELVALADSAYRSLGLRRTELRLATLGDPEDRVEYSGRLREFLRSRLTVSVVGAVGTGLGLNIVQSIARIMVELNAKSGLGVVFVEQNIDMIRAMAQRCYVMDKGRITATLTRADLDDQNLIRSYLSV